MVLLSVLEIALVACWVREKAGLLLLKDGTISRSPFGAALLLPHTAFRLGSYQLAVQGRRGCRRPRSRVSYGLSAGFSQSFSAAGSSRAAHPCHAILLFARGPAVHCHAVPAAYTDPSPGRPSDLALHLSSQLLLPHAGGAGKSAALPQQHPYAATQQGHACEWAGLCCAIFMALLFFALTLLCRSTLGRVL